MVPLALGGWMCTLLQSIDGEFADGSIQIPMNTSDSDERDLILLLDEDPTRMELTKSTLESLSYSVLDIDQVALALDVHRADAVGETYRVTPDGKPAIDHRS